MSRAFGASRGGIGQQYDPAMSWYGSSWGGQPQIVFGGLQWANTGTPGVTLISGVDPTFNAEEFLSFAQGVFLRVAAARAEGRLAEIRPLVTDTMWQQLNATRAKRWRPIDQVEHASIVTAQHDAAWDTVTVRFAARATDKKRSEVVEDWTFQRQAAAGAAEMPHECPSCGAPTSTDDSGSCRYCNVPIAGARGGWHLVRIAEPSQQASSTVSRSAAGWVWFVIIIILVTTVVPIVAVVAIGAKVSDSVGTAFTFPTSTVPTRPVPSISVPQVSIPALPGTLKGRATVSGAVNSTIENGTNITLVGGESGSCNARAAQATGLQFVFAGTDSRDGVQKTLSVNASVPAGQRGPGTYDLPATGNSITVTYVADAASASQVQTFTAGTGSAVTLVIKPNASGTLTFSGLTPQTPSKTSLAQPLSGSVTFSC